MEDFTNWFCIRLWWLEPSGIKNHHGQRYLIRNLVLSTFWISGTGRTLVPNLKPSSIPKYLFVHISQRFTLTSYLMSPLRVAFFSTKTSLFRPLYSLLFFVNLIEHLTYSARFGIAVPLHCQFSCLEKRFDPCTYPWVSKCILVFSPFCPVTWMKPLKTGSFQMS